MTKNNSWKFPLASIWGILYIACSINHAKGRICPPHTLPCDSKQCILRQQWCDKSDNCVDKSDEKYCAIAGWFKPDPNNCASTHFLCGNGQCIPNEGKCDEYVDCRDGSDEKNCNATTTSTTDITDEDYWKSASSPPKSDTFNGDLDNFFDSPEEKSSEETSSSDNMPTDSNRNSWGAASNEAKFYARRVPENLEHPYSQRGYGADRYHTNYDGKNNFDSAGHRSSDPTAAAPNYSKIPHDGYGEDRRQEGVHSPELTSSWGQQTPPPDRQNHPYLYYPYHLHGYNQWAYSLPEGCIPTPSTVPYNPVTSPHRGWLPTTSKTTSTTRATTPKTTTTTRTTTTTTIRTTSTTTPAPTTRRNGPSGRKYPIYNRRKTVLIPFYFQRNYTLQFGKDYDRNVRRAQWWLMEHRNLFWGWGKDTARALIALSLINNSFVSGITDNDAMKKQFQVHLGVNLLRHQNKPITLSRLAIYINAMFATCQNPRSFNGYDLVQTLLEKKAEVEGSGQFVNPIVYIALCLADHVFSLEDLQPIVQLLTPAYEDEFSKDMQSLATTALACYLHLPSVTYSDRRQLKPKVDRAVSSMLDRRLPDGGFGSIYSTALVAQALFSVNTTVSWDPRPTLEFLASHQTDDGCFGDLLSTYYILPVLRGRSLLHLRNTFCDPPIWGTVLTPQEILDYPGPKYYVYYSLYFGNPMEKSYTVTVSVPVGINFFDIMRVAEYLNSHFKFSYEEEEDGNTYVYAISDIPNDSERGFYWHLYVTEYPQNGYRPGGNRLYTGAISMLLPKASEHLIFWYHRDTRLL